MIGAGLNGQEHIAVTLLEGRATVHGVFDPNPLSVGVAKQVYARLATQGELLVYDSLEQACRAPDEDGLILCTPNYTHLDVVEDVVKSGKHILLEKPMATTIQDACTITQLASGHKFPALHLPEIPRQAQHR